MATITKTITGSTGDGVLNKSDANYTTCHDAAVADLDPEADPSTLAIGQVYASEMYTINRTGIIFDTSSIPLNINISSAIVKLACDTDGKVLVGTDFDVVIQNGQPDYPSNPVVEADYDCSFYSGNGGSINTVDVVEESFNDIPLNDTGKDWINEGGFTKLLLRSSREIASTVPTGYEGIFFLAANYGADMEPKLEIIYHFNDDFELPVDELLSIEIESSELVLPEIKLPEMGYDINIDYNWSHLSGRIKPLYTKEDVDKLRARCIRHLENLDRYCQVINRNKETIKTWLQEKYDDTTYDASSNFVDVISPQYMNTLSFDKLELTDFEDMINHFVRNHNRNNLILNGNFNTVSQWINDYAPSNDNNMAVLPMNSQQIADDEPDLKMLHTALSLLNRDLNGSIRMIYGNLQTIKEWIMV